MTVGSVSAAVVTVSDTRSLENDESGARLARLITDRGWEVVRRTLVTDDRTAIREALVELSTDGLINVVLTTGGTGLGPRDVTPEATLDVIEREVRGIAETIRAESLKFTKMAMLSRGVAGASGRTLIINLPGSPRAAEQSFDAIADVLGHAVALLAGDTEHK